MKRMICVLSSMNTGGAETFLMKIYRQMDRAQYQMDFCISTPDKSFYEDEILSMGGRVYHIPSKSDSLKTFSEQLGKLIRENGYKYVLRITSNAMGFLDLKIAKKAGAKICAARSSNSSDGTGWKLWVAHRLGRLLYGKYVDVKFAPSDLAARYTFGNRAYKAGKVSILHNAVDLRFFSYDESNRTQVRKEFGVAENTLLVGHVGRFDVQKNHTFLLRIFNEMLQEKPDSKLLLVGNGTLEKQLRDEVVQLGITDNVIFAGVRSDIPRVLSAMDVFVFPSLYEGMPNTVIESQATGLPCVIADTITRQADITGLVEYLPLGNAQMWADRALAAVKEQRADTKKSFIDNKYDIESTTNYFIELIFGE